MSTMPSDSSGSAAPTRVRYMVFVLGFGTSWMLYLHRYSFALIKPFLKEELDVSNTELGMMDTVFSMTYAGLQFPTGLLGDMAGVHWLLGGLILLWSIALAGHAWAPTKGLLYVFRALFGAGQAGVFSLVGRLTRCWFPASVRTTVQGWVGVFAGRFGGLAANILVLTVMIGIWGLKWQTALYILAAAGIVHGIVFLVAFRNSPRQHPGSNDLEVDLVEGEEGAAANEPLKFRDLLRQMDRRSIFNLAYINISSILSSVADQIYSLWIPLFLFEQYALKFKEMGIYSALPLLGGACGGMFGGFISDRLIRMTGNRRWVRSLVGCFGKAMAAAILAIAVLFCFDDPYVFCGMLFGVKFFADISLASRWGTVTDVGGKATATVFAFNNSVASFVAMFFPAVYGWVSETYDWQTVFWMACASYVGCSIAWLWVDCTVTILASDRQES